MESKSSGGADGEAEAEGTAARFSCFGLGSLDGSVPRIESSRMCRMTEGVSAGDVGDIGESGMAMSAKRPSPGAPGLTSPGQPVLAGGAEGGSESVSGTESISPGTGMASACARSSVRPKSARKTSTALRKTACCFPPAQVVHELLQQPPGVEWTLHPSARQKSHGANLWCRR